MALIGPVTVMDPDRSGPDRLCLKPTMLLLSRKA